MMGTVIEVISPDSRAADIAFGEIERIENLLSLYKEESEISRLNKQGSLRVSPQTLLVINKAIKFWGETGGVFDITIAPLVELWGFYNKDYHIPEDAKIKKTLSLIGIDKMNLRDNIVEFEVKGMKIDLGAIAKGFAVDCAVRELRLAGIDSALLNAGGDIYCLGNKFGQPWRVAIKSGRNKGFSGYLELSDKAVATSGDYEQYFVVDQKRYSHILNPKTGRPADSGVVSVTVIVDDCLTADILATSILILGQKKGIDLAKRFNAEVRIIEETNVR
ncbi:MAG: FAD:protein FMN transferase [Candidatus Omnitrophota bacterium]